MLIRALCVALLLAGPAGADEILFNNGDKLTGKIKSLEDGKLLVDTAVAGTVKVNLADIKTFSTAEPIEIHLQGGTVLKQKVNAAEAGQFAVADGAVAAQAIPIAQVAKVNPPPVKWTGDINAGLLITRGNAQTTLANVAVNLLRRDEVDRITVNAAYFYGRQDGQTSVDNWFAQVKYDYFFTPRFYGYLNTRVEKDRIADLDLRLNAGAGAGYQWIDRDDFHLSTEAGASWFYEDFSNETPSNDHIALRLAYHVDKKINDKVVAFHNLQYFPSTEELGDYFINADLGARVALTGTMFAELKIIVDYDSTPADGATTTSAKYALSIGWAF